MILTTSFYHTNQKKNKQTNKAKQKRLFQNFSWFQFYIYNLCDNVHWHCSIDYCVKLTLVDDNYVISASYVWGNEILGGELPIDGKKKLESAFYVKSGVCL